MNRPLRFVVVGAGHLGRIHAKLVASHDDIELVGVVDPVAASGVAKEFGTLGFASLDEAFPVLHRPDLVVDGAIVATPTVTHDSVAQRLLGNGIHVLVEKPITDDVETAQQLVKAAESARRVLQVGHVERFNPAVEVAQARIQDPKFIEARRLCRHTFRSTDVGVVHDLMIHDIDLVLSTVKSRPVDVQAFGVSVLGDSEDIAHATIRFENGCIANLVASRVSLEAERRLNVYMPIGFVGVDMQSGSVDNVSVGESLLKGFALSDVPSSERAGLREQLFDGLMNHDRPVVHEQNAILEEHRDFARCIRESAVPRVDGQAGLAALKVAQEILDCIESHEWDGNANGRIGPFGISSRNIIRDSRLVPNVTKEINKKAG